MKSGAQLVPEQQQHYADQLNKMRLGRYYSMCTGSSAESGLARSHSMYYYIYKPNIAWHPFWCRERQWFL